MQCVTDIFVVIESVTSPGDNQIVINDKQAACELENNYNVY